MAPRAGFEVGRKLLSARVVQCVDEGNTPARTPRLTSLEFWKLGGRVHAAPTSNVSTVSSRPAPIGELEGSSCRATSCSSREPEYGARA
jgi:hypothetical protein